MYPPSTTVDTPTDPLAKADQVASYARSVIFLDWDDTLFPSSYLAALGYRLDSETISSDVLKELKEVEHWVGQLLEILATKGDVYIVTNAETGWVELSAAKFIPAMAPKVNSIEVVSARTKYEALFPNCPFKWKFFAFKERMSSMDPQYSTQPCQVLSFGDSNYEREAVRSMSQQQQNLTCKSIKFHERPTMEQLLRQLELVIKSVDYIFDHKGHLDLQLSICE